MQLGAVAFDLGLWLCICYAWPAGIRERIEEGAAVSSDWMSMIVSVGDWLLSKVICTVSSRPVKALRCLSNRSDEPAVDVLARLVEPTGIQQLNDLLTVCRRASCRGAGKPARSNGCTRKTSTIFLRLRPGLPLGRLVVGRSLPARRWGGRGSHKGIDLVLLRY